MLPDRGRGSELAAVDPAWLAGVTWLHVPAYSLCAEPIGTATPRGGPAHPARRWPGERRRVVGRRRRGVRGGAGSSPCSATSRPDVVFANAAEARPRGRGAVRRCSSSRTAPGPVVLHGADGHVETVAVTPVERVVDSTGAGDAFAGGFLAATLAGASPRDAARAGAALAARTLRVAGAALGTGGGMMQTAARFDWTWISPPPSSSSPLATTGC